MEYENPTPENLLNSMNAILEKNYDAKTRVKFFLGFLKVVESEPENIKLLLLEKIDKIVNEM